MAETLLITVADKRWEREREGVSGSSYVASEAQALGSYAPSGRELPKEAE
jgi:hypothetical protein